MIKDLAHKLKTYLIDLRRYPKYGTHDGNYEVYWASRGLSEATTLNTFQKARADHIAATVKANSSILDIAAGDGGILKYVQAKKPLSKMIGTEISETALSILRARGIEAVRMDLLDDADLKALPRADYVLMLEILEHLKDPERLLAHALQIADEGAFFSVPNTGFVMHRLRLLFGRFPLQWKVHPSEHLRYWTVSDMKWWLESQGYRGFSIHLYEGIPLFNRIVPSLFGQGMVVFVPRQRAAIE